MTRELLISEEAAEDVQSGDRESVRKALDELRHLSLSEIEQRASTTVVTETGTRWLVVPLAGGLVALVRPLTPTERLARVGEPDAGDHYLIAAIKDEAEIPDVVAATAAR